MSKEWMIETLEQRTYKAFYSVSAETEEEAVKLFHEGAAEQFSEDYEQTVSCVLTSITDDPECGNCPGWAVFNADPETGHLGAIERCDVCQKLANDDEAVAKAREAGYVVDDNYNVISNPPQGESS